MEILIPLHASCAYMKDNPSIKRVPVLIEGASLRDKNEETYLHLRGEIGPDDFDLQMDKDGATVLFLPAIHHANRSEDEDVPRVNAEEYTKRGAEIARSLHFGSAVEYLAAWVNEDRKQAALMHDIDAVLSLNILPKLPQWIRHDVMMVLESETMKQIFAERFFEENKQEPLSPNLPDNLKAALRHNAEHKTDNYLSQIMAHVLQTPPSYDGSANAFYHAAEERMKAFQLFV